MGGHRGTMEDGSSVFALRRQNSLRIANQPHNSDEDNVIPPNRMPDESFTKEKDIDGTSHASNQLKARIRGPKREGTDFEWRYVAVGVRSLPG